MNLLRRLARLALPLAAAALAAPPFVRAAEPQPGVPEVSIERLQVEDEKLETLKFLSENREFFRAQLDLLRQTFGALKFGNADGLDPRSLMLKELLAAGRAASDSASLAAANDRTRGLLESVADLAALESEMNAMEESLGAQRERLARLEEDFVGRQETALVVLATGVPSRGMPEEIVLREEGGDTFRLTFSADENRSIADGGLAQLFHAFVEPRELRFSVSCRGASWEGAGESFVVVAPERDRLTFLELDLATLGQVSEESIPSRAWVW